jgi:GNAT superfamily N-acetyltransferase
VRQQAVYDLVGVHVRRITSEDALLLKEVRLAALEEAPSAFGSTHAAEATCSDAEWRERASAGAAGNDRAMFFAVLQDAVVGLAGGYRDEPSSATVELVSMWVAPPARNRGVGSVLVDAVATWAAATNARTVSLWVTRGNTSAEQLYASMGFIASGETQPLPSDPTMEEARMERSLP